MLLDSIKNSEDLKALNPAQYAEFAEEIRSFLIDKVSEHGGHLASNLGVVELTMALHIALDLPEDKIIWDVGHQAYTHKLLSGRREEFDTLREYQGLSGFPKRHESPYDAFDTGHSSTSISAGLGYVEARDRLKQNYTVVSVIGDGALSGGMAYEALNNVSSVKSNFIIILNDNEMSISKSTGGFSGYLSQFRVSQGYNNLKKNIRKGLSTVPGVGQNLVDHISDSKMAFKQFISIPGRVFEDLDINYIGPIDGHNVKDMVRILLEAKQADHPILIHIKTQKGKGYRPAELNPSKFHGISPFDIRTGQTKASKKSPDYTQVFSETICELAGRDKRICAITAAMLDGTGLKKFQSLYPKRLYDVGIAEEHAVTFAAGMAAGGLKPVVAIYSTFLQRAYDQLIHDVCLQELPVVFAVDRSGLVGADGETHQGIFDLSYLCSIPGMTVFAPKNAWELKEGLSFGLGLNRPFAIRYPRGAAFNGLTEHKEPIKLGKSEWIWEGSRVMLLAIGSMVETAVAVRELLLEKGIDAGVINARFAAPLDDSMLQKLSEEYDYIVTLEENVLRGGFGESVSEYLYDHGFKGRVYKVGIPDRFVNQGNVSVLKKELQMDAESVASHVLEDLDERTT